MMGEIAFFVVVFLLFFAVGWFVARLYARS